MLCAPAVSKISATEMRRLEWMSVQLSWLQQQQLLHKDTIGIMAMLPYRGFEKCSLILVEHNPKWIWQFISKSMYQQAKYCHRQI